MGAATEHYRWELLKRDCQLCPLRVSYVQAWKAGTGWIHCRLGSLEDTLAASLVRNKLGMANTRSVSR